MPADTAPGTTTFLDPATLEAAARACEAWADGNDGHGNEAWAAMRCAEAIRRLVHGR